MADLQNKNNFIDVMQMLVEMDTDYTLVLIPYWTELIANPKLSKD